MTMPSSAPDPAHQPAPGPAFDPGFANERTVTTREFLQIFTAVMLPMLMAIIDQTLLATATPVIAADLGVAMTTQIVAAVKLAYETQGTAGLDYLAIARIEVLLDAQTQ